MAVSVAGVGTAAFAEETEKETNTAQTGKIVLTGTSEDTPKTGDNTKTGGTEKNEEPLEDGNFAYSYNASAAAGVAADTYTVKEYLGSGTNVSLPQTFNKKPVVSVASGAFAGKSVQSVTITNTVTYLANGALTGCGSLKEVIFTGGAPVVAAGALPNQSTLTVHYPAGYAAQYVSVREGYSQIHWVIDGTVSADSVTLNKTKTALKTGQTEKLTASIVPYYTTDDALTWSSSNTAVATVDSDGTVTAVKSGTATVSVKTENGKTASCSVTVTDPTLKLSQSAVTIKKGASCTLTAVRDPKDSTDTITWESSNDAVAVVTAGKITAVKPGTATIKATTKSGLSDSCTVTVLNPTFTLSKTAVTINKGDTCSLTAARDPEDDTDTVTWTSSDTDVASVNAGEIKAIKAGTAKITATTKSGLSDSCTVTVKAPATAVKLNKTTAVINKGKTLTLKATVAPADTTDKLTWSSSNTAVAKVTGSGKVTAVKAGTAKITVKTTSGKTAVCTVKVAVPSTAVKLNITYASLEITTTLSLKATVTPADSTDTVTWSSSNPAVAAVSSRGFVTAVKPGTATVTAKTTGGKSATCTITVLPSVSSVKMNKSSTVIESGKSETLKATAYPTNAARRSLTWSSSNTAVATVSSSGKVTGKKAGYATITAKTPNGKKATCKVRVELVRNYRTTANLNYRKGPGMKSRISGMFLKGSVVRIVKGYSKKANGYVWWKVKINGQYYYLAQKYLKVIPVTKVTLSKTATAGLGAVSTLKATITPSNATYPELRWSSSNTKIAVVSGGKITGKKLGTVTVTVKSKNGKKSSSKVTVKLKKPTGLKGVSVSETSVKLTWQKVPGAAGYRIYRASGINGSYQKIKTISSGSTTAYTNTGLSKNRTYYYKIKAYHTNSKYNSKYSDVLKALNGRVGFTSRGIDVSAWQGKIDWAKVKADGIQFAIIRAGYGTYIGQKDAYFDYNVQQAKKYGIKVGAYWFSYATTAAEAKKEAQVCYEVIKNYELDYPVFYDFEYDSVNYANGMGVTITKAKSTAFTEAFCQELASKNVNVGVYTNPDCIYKYFEWDTLNKYPLWLAHWDVAEPAFPCDLWQYSSSGYVNGISGRVDMNLW